MFEHIERCLSQYEIVLKNCKDETDYDKRTQIVSGFIHYLFDNLSTLKSYCNYTQQEMDEIKKGIISFDRTYLYSIPPIVCETVLVVYFMIDLLRVNKIDFNPHGCDGFRKLCHYYHEIVLR